MPSSNRAVLTLQTNAYHTRPQSMLHHFISLNKPAVFVHASAASTAFLYISASSVKPLTSPRRPACTSVCMSMCTQHHLFLDRWIAGNAIASRRSQRLSSCSRGTLSSYDPSICRNAVRTRSRTSRSSSLTRPRMAASMPQPLSSRIRF